MPPPTSESLWYAEAMNRLFSTIMFFNFAGLSLFTNAMERDDYYASVSSVQHGLAPVSYTHLTLPTTPYV